MHSRTNSSLSTISSIVTVLFVICLSSRACSASSEKHQHRDEQPTTAAAPAAGAVAATTAPNQNAELLRTLLALAASSQQQASDSTLAQEANELKFVDGDGLAAKRKQSKQAAFDAKLAAENARQKKLAIKRKLHKLVDEIVDESTETDDTLKDVARRRSLTQNQQVQPQQQQQQKDDGLVIIMKRRPLDDNNELGDLFSQPQQLQQQQPPRRLKNLNEHTRNILDDSFGIRRDSIFTTNNHLGSKGTPKFGSEEQF